jgi:hypothetical protein
MAKIAFLPALRTRRACAGCGTNLERAPSWWKLCRRCFGFHQFRKCLDAHLDALRARS